MIDLDEVVEKVILVAVDLDRGEDIEYNLDELEELVSTAGAVTLAKMVQKKENTDKGTYIGSGKVEELRDMIYAMEATGIVCDDELSPMQIRNLEDELDVRVMDRTMVILDIFAKRAVTNEGKIQVELAQLKYNQSRLTGKGISMSRLGGGIGTRGPGEKKLETDRRLIRAKIGQLQKELDDVLMHRSVMRKQRMESNRPIVSIVGYTNAGKSTLLNHLTDAKVLEEDKLFATLDPTSRTYKLSDGQEIILTDTVGFIRKLPHHLINAFRSTLEEAKYADILVHVADISNNKAEEQIAAVYETLIGLGIEDKSVITVFNKIDKVDIMPIIKDLKAEKVINMSIKYDKGYEELNQALIDTINGSRKYIETIITYDKAGLLNRIRNNGTVLEEEYREDGIFVKAYIDKSIDI